MKKRMYKALVLCLAVGGIMATLTACGEPKTAGIAKAAGNGARVAAEVAADALKEKSEDASANAHTHKKFTDRVLSDEVAE